MIRLRAKAGRSTGLLEARRYRTPSCRSPEIERQSSVPPGRYPYFVQSNASSTSHKYSIRTLPSSPCRPPASDGWESIDIGSTPQWIALVAAPQLLLPAPKVPNLPTRVGLPPPPKRRVPPGHWRKLQSSAWLS